MGTRAKAKAAEPSRPPGRPTLYDPSMCETVRDFGRKGYSKAEMAAGLGVTRATMDNWIKLYPDFLNAVQEAQDLSLAWWEGKSRTGIEKGSAFNATLWSKAMSGRFPNEPYRERSELTGPNGGPIQTHQLTGRIAALPKDKRDAIRAALKGDSE